MADTEDEKDDHLRCKKSEDSQSFDEAENVATVPSSKSFNVIFLISKIFQINNNFICTGRDRKNFFSD